MRFGYDLLPPNYIQVLQWDFEKSELTTMVQVESRFYLGDW